MEDGPVEGGVLIVHQFSEGKHHYEVKSVIKNKREEGKKYFLRRGDKLRLVNNTELEDMDPEQLTTVLSQGNPMLTVHKTIRNKKPVVEKHSEEEVMVPASKEQRLLLFNQEMRREEDPGQKPGQDAGQDREQDNLLPTEEDPAGEEDVCAEEGEPTDFLVVSMKKTTISVIIGRSCDPKEPCHECHQTKCHYNDTVIVTESSSVALVPRGSGSFRYSKTNKAEVEHMRTNLFIRSLCAQKQVYMSQTPELINIYYYKSTQSVTKGLPVVLNFSGSDCFLMCCKIGTSVGLYVEMCEKQKLQNIALSDQNALAYVFYMKSERTGNTTFESARHPGWFIQSSDPNSVEMKPDGLQEEAFFHIIIQKYRL